MGGITKDVLLLSQTVQKYKFPFFLITRRGLLTSSFFEINKNPSCNDDTIQKTQKSQFTVHIISVAA